MNSALMRIPEHGLVRETGSLLLRKLRENLPQMLTEGTATVIKSGPHRAVYRLTSQNDAYFLKHCRIATTRSFLRECVRAPKARLEFDRAKKLLERGIPAPEPVAWDRPSGLFPGASWLLTRELPDTQSLTAFAETALTPEDRQNLARQLGEYFARLHNSGVFHPDPHPGNLLVRRENDRFLFFLLDLHAVRIGRPLSARDSRDNLILFNRWFQIRAERTDRRRFWATYSALRGPGWLPHPCRDARRLEQATQLSNRGFWFSRAARCRGSNRYFSRVYARGIAGHAVKEIDSAFLAELCRNPDAPFEKPGIAFLKNSCSSTVIEVEMPTANGPKRMIYKRFCLTSKLDPLTNLLRDSEALRSWSAGHGFFDRGLPTPRPWLVLHRRKWGTSREGYLLCEKVPDAVELQDSFSDSVAELRQRIDTVAKLLRVMHERNIAHRDLKAANLLVSPSGLHFIDLVGVTFPRRTSTDETKIRNLTRLNASFLTDSRLSRTDRLRFLRIYRNMALKGSANWKQWWKAIAAATEAKRAKNVARNRPLH